MARFLTVLRREYVERVRSKWFVLATLFGPLLVGILMFVPPWLMGRTPATVDVGRIAILDATGSEAGSMIAADLSGGVGGDTSRTILRAVTPGDLARAERQATEEALRGRIRGFLVLDSQTLTRFRAHYHGTNASSGADMRELHQVVRNNVLAARLAEEGVHPRIGKPLASVQLSFQTQRLTGRGPGVSGQVSIIFAVGVALLLYVSIFMYGQNVLRGVMEEKQTRVAEVVLASVSPGTLLAGKIAGVGAVGLTQMTIWLLAGIGIFRARSPLLAQLGIREIPIGLPEISFAMAGVLLLFFLLGYLFYAALFAMVGATVTNEQDAQQAQIPIVMLLVSSIFFLGPILASPESGLGYTMGWLPFSAPIIMPLRMSVTPLSNFDIAAALLILACSCYIAIWAAARVYRVGLLMYGKRPTLREAARWLSRSA